MASDGSGDDTAAAVSIPAGTTALLRPGDGPDPLAFVGDWRAARPTLVGVTVDRSIRLFLSEWRASTDAAPEDAGLVGVGEAVRSAADHAPTDSRPGGAAVRTVADPTDLDAVADHVRALLDGWRDREEPTVVVVDSVTGLLDVAPKRAVAAFAADLAETVADAGAVGFLVVRCPTDPDLDPLLAACDDAIEARPGGWRPVESGARREPLPVDEAFALLANHRRRRLLRYLDGRDRATVEELADTLVDGSDSGERGRLVGSLVHAHLPKLDDADVVEYDATLGVVAATPAVERLASILEFASARRG